MKVAKNRKGRIEQPGNVNGKFNKKKEKSEVENSVKNKIVVVRKSQRVKMIMKNQNFF